MKRSPTFLATGSRHFLAVAEAGSVRGAARRLNVAASAISRQLRLLEEELGTGLLDRDGHSITLTPAGEILLRGLRAAKLGQDEILEQLDGITGLRRGTLRIATVESVSVSILPQILQKFAQRHPGITFSVTVAVADAVTELVREHRAEVGFTFNPRRLDGLDVAQKSDLRVGAVLAPGHPLAKARKLTLAQCLEYPLAWPSEGLSLRAILDRPLGRKRMTPAFECNSLRLMAALAREGRCIAFQTPIGIEQELRDGHLKFIPLADKSLAADQLMILKRRAMQKRPAVTALLALVAEHLRDHALVPKL
ncbi:MAG: LysR family transcriptional regulator [Alphaproteobacteria bacterium]|nr:LysR family transcriptional regulator [Alphaproteobacteria bacterium]